MALPEEGLRIIKLGISFLAAPLNSQRTLSYSMKKDIEADEANSMAPC